MAESHRPRKRDFVRPGLRWFGAMLIVSSTLLAHQNCSRLASNKSLDVNDDSSSSLSTPTPSATPSGEPPPTTEYNSCAPVRKYEFTLNNVDRTIACGGNLQSLGSFNVTVTGWAMARLTYNAASTNANNVQSYVFQVRVGQSKIAPLAKGDICFSSQTGNRHAFGYGQLVPGQTRVEILGGAASDRCNTNSLNLKAGAKVELWVEDSNASCEGKDIVAKSLTSENPGLRLEWMRDYRDAIVISTPRPPDRRSAHVFAQLEAYAIDRASPPHACTDANHAFAQSQVLVNDTFMSASQQPISANHGNTTLAYSLLSASSSDENIGLMDDNYRIQLMYRKVPNLNTQDHPIYSGSHANSTYEGFLGVVFQR